MPGLLLRVSFAKPETDLLRTPIQGELFPHKVAQHKVFADQSAAGAFGFVPGTSMREDGVLFTAVMSTHDAAQLPADRRGRTTKLSGNLAHRHTFTAENCESFSLKV